MPENDIGTAYDVLQLKQPMIGTNSFTQMWISVNAKMIQLMNTWKNTGKKRQKRKTETDRRGRTKCQLIVRDQDESHVEAHDNASNDYLSSSTLKGVDTLPKKCGCMNVKINCHRNVNICEWLDRIPQKCGNMIGMINCHRNVNICEWLDRIQQKYGNMIGKINCHRNVNICEW